MTDRLVKVVELMRLCYTQCRVQLGSAHAANDLEDDSQKDDYIREAHEYLAERIRQLYAAILMGFDELGYGESASLLKATFAEHSQTLTQISYPDGEPDYPYSPAVNALGEFVHQIGALVELPSNLQQEGRVLLRLLEQTPTLIASRARHPMREKDVQDELESVLTIVFPSTIREPTIPQPTKIYKPDFGISDLSTAVEVKFISSKNDVGRILGELYEDMKGYAGSPDWRVFIGLIYATGSYLSQHRLEAEAQRVGVAKDWILRIVVGPGGKTKQVSVNAGAPSIVN